MIGAGAQSKPARIGHAGNRQRQMNDADFVQDLRTRDPDRYLSVLYAPADKRQALFALYAFNAEIASVRDRVSEPLPGEIRLQWWRDVLAAGTPDAAGGHPLATALVETVRTHNLPLRAFENMLDARIFDLYDDPMPSRSDLEGYCGETASALIQLAAMILDPANAASISTAAGHAGCAQAIVGLIRSIPLHRARGQCYVPRDMLEAAGTTPEAFIELKDKPAAQRALDMMIALGREHWNAYTRNPLIPGAILQAFQPAKLTPLYLREAARAGGAALTSPLHVPQWRRQWYSFRNEMLPLLGTGISS